jgi:diguanylate cyclase (GGDEF)-like protein
MGRAVGVIHATGKPEDDVEENQIQDLSTLAKLAGARIGLLRVMAETQLQASTDTLTGLLNRRSFSELVGQVPLRQHPMAIAMADLDQFKVLNDTYGHDTGDRALRLFARVMRDTLRTSDLVCRYGGEEFAIAFADCAAADAMHAIQSVRAQLDAAITVAGLPKFTASYGVTDKEPGEQLESALRRADDALLSAKRAGRDQVVHHDADITPTNGAATDGHEANGHDANGIRRRNGNSHPSAPLDGASLMAQEGM